MDALRFDRFSRSFAQRRRLRHAMTQTGEATPEAMTEGGSSRETLFVQSFKAGAITPKEGTEGRYTLALEGGHGQTIFFSSRPDRFVGAQPTEEFLEALGFLDDNPPNAALIVDTAPGVTDVAVVELFSPVYDSVTEGVTYEIEVLQNWQAEMGFGLEEAPTDLAALAPAFGAAHLFIDGCPDASVECWGCRGDDVCRRRDYVLLGTIGPWEQCWTEAGCCPCVSSDSGYWMEQCEAQFPDCGGICDVKGSERASIYTCHNFR